MKKALKITRKRAIAAMLSVLMLVSLQPLTWSAANASSVDCEIEEHTHSDECKAADETGSDENIAVIDDSTTLSVSGVWDVDGTAIMADTELYGHWVRNTLVVGGIKTWVENGEGFERPDSITVNFYRNGVLIDSCVVNKDDDAEIQAYSFDEVYECDEDGNAYNYTVEEETVPDGYVSVVSGYNITNIYNVDRFIITKEWDHSGNPDEYPESVDVELYCDDALYKTVTLNEGNSWTQTVTVPRLSSQGHTFSIKEISVDNYITTYKAPASEDTDNDGTADTVTFLISNVYDMPKISVGGSVAWDKIPAGMTAPEISVNLMLDGEVLDTVTLPADTSEYSFTELDRYAEDGTALNYTVEVSGLTQYETTYSDAAVDEQGNIVIDITNTGTFTYGSLTISSKVSGEDAPADAEFIYTVTLDSEVEYPFTGSFSGTIKSGDSIVLKDGESITISDILTGVAFTVEQNKVDNFVTAPSSGKAEGVISSTASVAEFINNFKLPPAGNLEISNKVIGNAADTSLLFPFKVEFDDQGSYEYKIISSDSVSTFAMRSANPTIKSGDIIELRHGDVAVIYGLPAGISYKVTEVDTKGYVMTSTGASGNIAEDGSKAAFINTRNTEVIGENDSPQTGEGYGALIAVYVMQIAMLSMLLCVLFMKRSKREDETM